MPEDTSGQAQRYVVNRPAVVSDFVDGEVVAVNLETGTYFAMFEGAALVWEALMRGASVPEIANRCLPGDDATLTALDAFVTELLAQDLLRSSDTRDPMCEEALLALEALGQLGSLQLHIHEDLQDMLLLDPVHDTGPAGWPESRED